MKITVDTRLFPMLAEVVGQEALEVDLQDRGTTIKDLIEELTRRYGQRAREALLDEGGKFDTMIQIVLNGERWIPGNELDTRLSDGDSVAFMLLIGGG